MTYTRVKAIEFCLRRTMFQLTTPGHPGDQVPLPPNAAFLIGRGDSCNMKLKDPSASRVHCRVIAHDGRVTLYDAGSRWGTFVNGKRVSECDLRPGDRIQVGETTLQLTINCDANHTTLARRSELQELLPDSRRSVRENCGGVRRVEDAPNSDESGCNAQKNASRGRDDDRNEFLPTAVPQDSDGKWCPEKFLGTSFHSHRINRLLAATSSGLVFQAESVDDATSVALKIFKPSCLTTDTAEQRFNRAMKTILGKRHPNIVELLDAGKWNGWFFTASEFIDGVSAVELIRRIGIIGMMPPDKALQIAIDLSQALHFAENNGIVHRNIRPSNILIRNVDGVALLNDLVLARSIEVTDSERLTSANDILGDVSYMSPEQLGSGYPLDHRSDIYQLGAALYALLTGRPPFEGGGVAATITQILTANPDSMRAKNMSIPSQLESVVIKMLAKNPRDRYPSAKELATTLDLMLCATQHDRVRSFNADPHVTGWRMHGT